MLAVMLAALAAPEAQAQEQKIGYVNTDQLLEKLPDYEGIREQLQLLAADWKKELASKENEIDRLRAQFQQREILFSDSVRIQRQGEIEALVQERQRYMEQHFGPDGDYFQRQQELLKPLQQRIMEAVGVVAQRQEFDFVFDRARQSSMLFGGEEWNLNEAVLRQMGISPDETSN
ncbi:MAG: OmpH family outer membrane protein [Balneolaceae bacterium]|nr:OmpH family outer membrane protein [Balneolaceae bacterium]